MRRNTTPTAIAGEYYVLAELARRDAFAFVAPSAMHPANSGTSAINAPSSALQ